MKKILTDREVRERCQLILGILSLAATLGGLAIAVAAFFGG